MTVTDLKRAFDYGHWANHKLFPVISQLTPDQFTRTVDSSHGSIRNTLVHIASAEWGWIARCGGPQRGAPLTPADFPTPESVLSLFNKIETQTREFLSKLQENDLARNIDFVLGGEEKRTMPMGELLQHAANHGVHHRGQISLLLRLLGYAPDDFDLLFYDIERHERPAR
jgi:uncharacterized damage-inducible protein DinB